MKSKKSIFPKLKKKLKWFLTDESGKISKKEALWLSLWAVLLTWINEVNAWHASWSNNWNVWNVNSSIKCHWSQIINWSTNIRWTLVSKSMTWHGSHGSHGSHWSHGSHGSHGSHWSSWSWDDSGDA